MQLQCKLRPEEEDRDGRGGGQTRCMSEGRPGGKLGMLCCWLSSSPLGSTALPQSHNYPLLQQAYALTASETPHLSPTFCLLHCPPLHCTPSPLSPSLPPALWPRRGEYIAKFNTSHCSPTLIRSLSTLPPPLLPLSSGKSVRCCACTGTA